MSKDTKNNSDASKKSEIINYLHNDLVKNGGKVVIVAIATTGILAGYVIKKLAGSWDKTKSITVKYLKDGCLISKESESKKPIENKHD